MLDTRPERVQVGHRPSPHRGLSVSREGRPKSLHAVFAMTGAVGLCGGIARANANVALALRDLVTETDGSLTLLSLLEHSEDRPRFLPESVDYRAFSGNKFAFASQLVRFALSRQVIVFDHVTLASPVLPFAATAIVDTVIFAHGSEAWKRVRRSSRLSFRYATLTLTNSDFTLRKMRARFQSFNAAACPLGLSPEFEINQAIPAVAEEKLQLAAADGRQRDLGDRVLLLVARMHPDEREKGHYELLSVLPTLLHKYPDMQLVFAGPGDDREALVEIAKKNNVAHSVFLPGRVSHHLLESLYRQCFAYVMPSRQEGFGLVYLEAMNYGKPCVGCRDDGAADVILHEKTGLLVGDPTDPAALSAVLGRLLADPEQAAQWGLNGFRRLHEAFTAEQHQQRVKTHLRGALGCD